MADEEEKPASTIPEWQRAQNNENEADQLEETRQDKADQPEQTQPEEEDKFVVARRFLADQQVKDSSRERKVAFLKEKGIDDADIENLLQEAEPSSSPVPSTQTTSTPPAFTPSNSSSELMASAPSRAPVVTYPEFLTPKDDSNSPLLTKTNILTILQVFTALSTLIAGTSHFVLSPMLERLTDARVDFHTSASDSLQPLISKLEKTVSKIPDATASRGDQGTDEDSDEDPSEMFHRDVGTQTSSFTPSPTDKPEREEKPSAAQSSRLEKFNIALKDLEKGMDSQSDSLGDVKTLVDVFRDDLDTLTYPAVDVNNYDSYSRSKKPEPEDEIRKVRDSIRRIKGALLTSRSFPASTR